MDKLTIYNPSKPESEGTKLPALKLEEDENGDIDLVAVDPETGAFIACLLSFDGQTGRLVGMTNARGRLLESGFSLPGARFDACGEIIAQ